MELNKRRLVTEIWNVDHANNISFRSYRNIPFFISTKGCGFILTCSCKSFYDIGSKSFTAYNVKVKGGVLDYFIIVGGEPKGILQKYYSLTGKLAMLP